MEFVVRSSVICYESQACHNPNLNYTSLYHSSSSGAVGTELGNVRQNQLVMMIRTEIDIKHSLAEYWSHSAASPVLWLSVR